MIRESESQTIRNEFQNNLGNNGNDGMLVHSAPLPTTERSLQKFVFVSLVEEAVNSSQTEGSKRDYIANPSRRCNYVRIPDPRCASERVSSRSITALFIRDLIALWTRVYLFFLIKIEGF